MAVGTTIPNNEATFTIDELLEATGGSLLRAGNTERIVGIGTDTRTLRPGQAFVALRGERFDGHDHVDKAVEAGASLLVVSRQVDVPTDEVALVLVDDTLRALGRLGRYHARRWRREVRAQGKPGKLVAVTGSAGKTTTCRAVHAVLTGAETTPRKVHLPAGNLNNAIGIPMVLLGLRTEHDYGVIEVGTNHPGEIAYGGSLVEPDVSLVTLVAAAHTEGLGDIEAVGREKTSLFASTSEDGTLVVNVDDVRVEQGAERHRGQRHVVRYGKREGVEVRIVGQEEEDIEQQRFMLQVQGRPVMVSVPMLGQAGRYAAAAALAAGLACRPKEFDLDRAVEALQHTTPEQGRLRPRRGLGGALILDDTYNANPASMEASMRTAAGLARKTGRRLGLVLGDMLELGALGQSAHEALGRLAVAVGAEWLVTVGPLAAAAARSAEADGLEVHAVGTAQQALDLLRSKIDENLVVLVKGSRGVHLEIVTDGLAEGAGERAT